jgi:hypothetical protein
VLHKKRLLAAVAAITASTIVLAGCGGSGTAKVDADTLKAVKAKSAVTVDGKGDEWANAPEIKIPISSAGLLGPGGKFTDGKTVVTLKAQYDKDNVYFFATWDDPTESVARGPWIFEGGKWVKKSYETHYEDKFAIQWNINDSVKGFNDLKGDTAGCMVSCHATGVFDEKSGKEIKKKYNNAAGELSDMWHWKLVRTNDNAGKAVAGQLHDQYTENTPYKAADGKITANAGRKGDPGNPEYKDNVVGEKGKDGYMPKFVFDGQPSVNPYVIIDGLDKVKPFDPSAPAKEGDIIPGLIAYKMVGDNGDVSAKGVWKDGKWTLEWSRKLVTGSQYDIQFADLKKTYYFGVAAFDNSQIGHAYHVGSKKFIFE